MAKRDRARTALQAAVVLLAGLGSSWVVFRHTLYELHAAAPQPEGAVVVAVAGDVYRLSPGKHASSLAVGQRLLPDESVRTGHGAHTDLVLGGRSRIRVAEGTQLTVREITRKLHRFKLSRGRIAVDYEADGERILRVESEDRGAVAEAQAARFGMLSTGAAVAIATGSGAVRLSAHDRTVTVPAGAEALALHGQPPSSAEPIAKSLLLRIAGAPAAATEAAVCADVRGTASPGSEVTIDGAPAAVAADGSFHVRVPAAQGRKSVLLDIRDAAGRRAHRTVPCAEAA
ncbi:MAG: FecR domain-containing protein, partial [Deltaproteobacteria bacterium]